MTRNKAGRLLDEADELHGPWPTSLEETDDEELVPDIESSEQD